MCFVPTASLAALTASVLLEFPFRAALSPMCTLFLDAVALRQAAGGNLAVAPIDTTPRKPERAYLALSVEIFLEPLSKHPIQNNHILQGVDVYIHPVALVVCLPYALTKSGAYPLP